MSRIQQLLRPQRRNIGTTIALPLLGLFAAGIAFYAHAGYQPHAAASASPAPVATPAPTPAPMASPSPLPMPRLTSGPVTTTPEPIAFEPTPPEAPMQHDVAMHGDGRDGSYALVRKGHEGFAMSGNTRDAEDIRIARSSIDGDFIWLRRDGKAYVIRDPAVLARVERAWQATDALSAQMDALSDRMQPHQEHMDALQARMDRAQERAEEPAAMHETQLQMQALSRQMQSLSRRQEALARQMPNGNDAQREELSRRMDALTLEQDTLTRQMDDRTQVMDTASHELERLHAPMEAIGKEMEAAARPMEAIGKDMEALGGQIEREAQVSEREMRRAIEDAMQRGLATPAPSRR